MNNYIFTKSASASLHEAIEKITFITKVKRGVRRVAVIAAFFLFAMSVRTEASEIGAAKQEVMLLQNINNLRTEQGLNPLVLDKKLIEVATVRAQECSTKWSHTRPNGKQGLDAIPGNVWKGENLSMMEGSASEATTAEMFRMLCESPTHYDNMVFEEFTRIGIASYEAADGCVYVAYMFAS